MKKIAGFTLAASAAALFAVVSSPVVQAEEKAAAPSVHCLGINGCKGQSNCKTATNACKGQNSCKGKGWLAVASEKECTDKGGKLPAAAK